MPLLTLPTLLLSSLLLHLLLLTIGLIQDTYSPLPYTDIDYYVFTDSARYLSRHKSPYLRETYRYTPLLAYLLLPTTFSPQWLWFSFGKLLFTAADVGAGWLIFLILRQGGWVGERGGMSEQRALKFAAVWLLNPMAAQISTRGSSEGLLGVLVAGLLWAVLKRRMVLAGGLLGLGVHFKIYPFVYGVSVLWFLESPSPSPSPSSPRGSVAALSKPKIKASGDNERELMGELKGKAIAFLNRDRLVFTLTSLATFTGLTVWMYAIYGMPFLQHTYLHHLTRIDHRHNFSVWNILLHISSMQGEASGSGVGTLWGGLRLEKLAFLPQLLLSAVLIPLGLAKKDLAGAMLCQTWAFVVWNKVVTSQYFLWYLILLPLYLPYSSLLERPRLGVTAGVLWVGTQAMWLQQAYNLEFLGMSTFVPNLFLASLAFFAVNVWLLGIMISDVGSKGQNANEQFLESIEKDPKRIDKDSL